MAVAFERSQKVGRVLDREDGARTQLLFHALIKFRKNPRRRVIALVQFCRTKKFLPPNKAKKKKKKKKDILPGGESNPGLPRDRRGYSPLYYRGCSRISTVKYS